jgi:hypothetical protein
MALDLMISGARTTTRKKKLGFAPKAKNTR